MCSEIVKNRPKSAECALSMVLLGVLGVGVAMATLVGLMNYLFLFLIGRKIKIALFPLTCRRRSRVGRSENLFVFRVFFLFFLENG